MAREKNKKTGLSKHNEKIGDSDHVGCQPFIWNLIISSHELNELRI